jgi:hypothetical protein
VQTYNTAAPSRAGSERSRTAHHARWASQSLAHADGPAKERPASSTDWPRGAKLADAPVIRRLEPNAAAAPVDPGKRGTSPWAAGTRCAPGCGTISCSSSRRAPRRSGPFRSYSTTRTDQRTWTQNRRITPPIACAMPACRGTYTRSAPKAEGAGAHARDRPDRS